MYAMIETRPDIAYSISKLSQYSSKSREPHWNAVKRVLQYLNGSLKIGITYQTTAKESKLLGYTDLDWAGNKETQ